MHKTGFVIAGRIIFAAIFLFAFASKVMSMNGTALYIQSAGFPSPYVLGWIAALFELCLSIAFLTGAYFSAAATVAAAYILFLGIFFHGPDRWENQLEFGLFLNHLAFLAGLLFAAAYGPGRKLVVSLQGAGTKPASDLR